MRTPRRLALGLGLVVLLVVNVQAGELQILAGGGIAVPLKEIAAQFERASGHKVAIRFGTTPQLIKMSTSEEPFDLGVVPQDVMKDSAARAQFASGEMPSVARVGLALAVRHRLQADVLLSRDGAADLGVEASLVVAAGKRALLVRAGGLLEGARAQ